MNKEFVPYEEALDLKQLGFDEPCFGWWFVDEKMLIIEKSKKSTSENIIQAPLFQQAFRWFREKHGLYVHSVPEFYLDGINFNWQILWYLPKDQWVKDEDGRVRTFTEGTMLYGDNGEYPTQEEADLACLKKMIEITKEKFSQK